MLRKEDSLNGMERMIIKYVYHMDKYTVFYNREEHIFVNPEIKNSKELISIIKKIYNDRLLYQRTEKMFDEVAAMTDEQTANELHHAWLEWLEKVRKLELNETAGKILKDLRSNRLYYKSKKEREIIKELFNIGFGLYDDKSDCNWQQGAENAFMYGYLMGMNFINSKKLKQNDIERKNINEYSRKAV